MSNSFYRIIRFFNHFFTALRRGHGVHSPFAYKLCEEVFYNESTFYDFEILDVIRKNILSNNRILKVNDLGAGSKVFNGSERKVRDIANYGISNKKQAEIIYRLVNFLKCKNCLELGTSLGLTTIYISKAASKGNVNTIEGSEALWNYAFELGQQNKIKNVNYIHANFDIAIPKLLSEVKNFDFVYFDGNHQYEASIRYFEWLLQKKHTGSVFVFDDIYWSKDMTKAWREIQSKEEVTFSIDCYHFGFIFFVKDFKEKTHLKFYI